jgi:DNA-binding LytR/AlgR family response regulator
MATPVWLKSKTQLIAVDAEDVVRIDACGNYVLIYFRDNQPPLKVRMTLQELHGGLADPALVRIHRSHVVRIAAIKTVTRDEVLLRDGARVAGSAPLLRKLWRRLREGARGPAASAQADAFSGHVYS